MRRITNDEEKTIYKERRAITRPIFQKLRQSYPSTSFVVTSREIEGIAAVNIEWSGSPSEFEVINSIEEFDYCTSIQHHSKPFLFKMPYLQAIQQRNNTDFILVVHVSWASHPNPRLQSIAFETIPDRIVPLAPDLPIGYQMQPHEMWLHIKKELSEAAIAVESPIDLGAIRRDWSICECKIGYRYFGYFPIDRIKTSSIAIRPRLSTYYP